MFERNALGSNARRMKMQYNSFTLKVIAAALTVIGTVGVSILQNGIMNLGSYSTESLLEAFYTEGNVFALATAVILCSGVAAFALPVYAHLLVEGYQKTSSCKKYAIRLIVLAILSEVPYDLAMQDTWFTLKSQNPVWGALIALIMLYFLDYFREIGKFIGFLFKLFIVAAALFWVIFLHVNYGIGMVLVVAVLWLLEGNGILTTFAGIVASLAYFPAPFGFIINYFYNGEKGSASRKIFYVFYPLQLLILGLIGKAL